MQLNKTLPNSVWLPDSRLIRTKPPDSQSLRYTILQRYVIIWRIIVLNFPLHYVTGYATTQGKIKESLQVRNVGHSAPYKLWTLCRHGYHLSFPNGVWVSSSGREWRSGPVSIFWCRSRISSPWWDSLCSIYPRGCHLSLDLSLDLVSSTLIMDLGWDKDQVLLHQLSLLGVLEAKQALLEIYAGLWSKPTVHMDLILCLNATGSLLSITCTLPQLIVIVSHVHDFTMVWLSPSLVYFIL